MCDPLSSLPCCVFNSLLQKLVVEEEVEEAAETARNIVSHYPCWDLCTTLHRSAQQEEIYQWNDAIWCYWFSLDYENTQNILNLMVLCDIKVMAEHYATTS